MIPLQQVWPSEFAERYRQAGYWSGETFGTFLHERVADNPDKTAVVDGTMKWSYAELDRRANALAAGFLEIGLVPGDRVVVQLPNVAQFLSVALGLFRAGVVPVFTLPAHRRVEIVHFIKRAEASAYLINDTHDGFDYRGLAASVLNECPEVRHVFVNGEAGRFTSLAELERNAPNKVALPSLNPANVALLQLSGGSTGISKLIPRTHNDYIYSIRASVSICELKESSIYLGVLPIAHNFPMSSPGIFGTLYAGATVVMCPSPNPGVAFPIIERERVTITGVVPPIGLAWLDAAPTTRCDLSSLKVLQIGGAKLMPEVARRVRQTFGATLQQVFGMAEGLVNYTRLDDPEETIVSTQGRPISPDDEIMIVDDSDIPVPCGTAGNLLTRGPYTIRAYHNAPGTNERSFTKDGFYRTGDVVRKTIDGNLIVEGRVTDQINRGGEKVSAEEVEDRLLAHPNVHDAAVVSVPDPYLGERTCAFIIPRGSAPRSLELKEWVRSQGVAAFKVPDQIVFVESFPSTGVGKVNRGDLRAVLRDQIINREKK